MYNEAVRIFFRLIVIVCALMPIACATVNRNNWIGHSESELVSTLGPPDAVYPLNERQKVLTYNTFSNAFPPGHNTESEISYVGREPFYPPSYGKTPPQNKGDHFKTDFLVQDGQVISYSQKQSFKPPKKNGQESKNKPETKSAQGEESKKEPD